MPMLVSRNPDDSSDDKLNPYRVLPDVPETCFTSIEQIEAELSRIE